MTELQPAPPNERVKIPEDEIRAAISPSVAHIAFGAVKEGLLKPVPLKPSDEQKSALQAATPDALKPIIAAGNAVSMDSRREAPQMEVKVWKEKVWTLLNGYVAEDVEQGLREERLKAFASLDLKLDDPEKGANGMHPEIETFRETYVDYDSSNIGLFVENVAKGCKNEDGSTDIKALQTRMKALEPVLGIFGQDIDVKDLINDFAMAHGVLSQKGEAKTIAVSKAATELNRPFQDTQERRLQKLWDKMPPDKTAVSQETQDDPETQPLSEKKVERGRRIKAANGAYYTVMSGPDAKILVLRSDEISDKKLVWHDEAEKILKEAEPDTVQVGMSVVRRDDGKEYVVERVHRPEKGGPVVHLKNPDGSRVTIAINDFREKIQTEGSPWRISETKVKDEAPKAPEKIQDEPLTPELARRDPEKFKQLLIQKLGEKHPLAQQAWDYAVNNNIISFDDITLITTDLDSNSHSSGFGVTTLPFDKATRAQFFEDLTDFEKQTLHVFTHELNHHLLSKVFAGKSRDFDNIFRMVKAIRKETPDEGLSLLGGNKKYQEKENPAYEQAKEDLTEMLTMYMLDPRSLRRFLDTVGSPDPDGTKARKGLAEISRESADIVYTRIENAIQTGLEQPVSTEPRKENTLNDAPLTDAELALGRKYLVYADVTPSTEEADRQYFETTPRAKYYARELTQMVDEFGENVLVEKAQENIARLQLQLQPLGLTGHDEGRSTSWYLWHAAKERFLADHPDQQAQLPNAREYSPFDPLAQYKRGVSPEDSTKSNKAEQDMLNTMLGWEVYARRSEVLTNLPITLSQTDLDRVTALLSDRPSNQESGSLSSYKLREIGALLSKTGAGTEPTKQEPPAGNGESVTLTNKDNVVQEMKTALGATDRESVTFATAPDVLIPFLQAKIAEKATVREPLQGRIIDGADGKKQMILTGKIESRGAVVTFNVTLQNTDLGLAVVPGEKSYQIQNDFMGIGDRKIRNGLSEIDQTLKEQIDNELGGAGHVLKVQIGDGVLVSNVKKG